MQTHHLVRRGLKRVPIREIEGSNTPHVRLLGYRLQNQSTVNSEKLAPDRYIIIGVRAESGRTTSQLIRYTRSAHKDATYRFVTPSTYHLTTPVDTEPDRRNARWCIYPETGNKGSHTPATCLSAGSIFTELDSGPPCPCHRLGKDDGGVKDGVIHKQME